MKVLSHPNIVKFKEEFVTHEYLYYVIEFVDGMDLFQYVNQYNVGIVHRDLKPENIMLRIDKNDSKQPAREVKLIDFGFAMYLKEAVCSQCCGTINYVAPEIFLGKSYNAKTDIFSLGVILFFMIRGELPFSHQVKEVVIRNIIKENYEMDSDEFFLNVSEDCKDLIRRMLKMKPVERIDIDSCLEHPWIVQHRRRKRVTTIPSSSRSPSRFNDSQFNGGTSPDRPDDSKDYSKRRIDTFGHQN